MVLAFIFPRPRHFFSLNEVHKQVYTQARKKGIDLMWRNKGLPLSLWKLRTIGLLFTSQTYIPESEGFEFLMTRTQTSPPVGTFGSSPDAAKTIAYNINLGNTK